MKPLKSLSISALAIAAFGIMLGAAWTFLDRPGRVLYLGGPILTMDTQNRVVEAHAVDGERIHGIGAEADLRAWAEQVGAEIIDLQGRAIAPGFIDAHGHFPGSGVYTLVVDLNSPPIGSVETVDDIVELLAKRAGNIVTFASSVFPLERGEPIEAIPEAKERVQRLLAEREFGADGTVIVNLQKHGTAEQRASDSAYGNRMMDGMAEGGYGPMHLGPAVRVEADYDHDFDQVVLVYYPGVEFFADLARSTFFQGIIGGKSLGDTQTNLTVPILDRL
jgi:hypothetical protein